MSWTGRERNMLIGIIAAVVIAALAGVYLLGRSSGEKTSTATTTTATQTTQTTPTQTQTVVTVTTPPTTTTAAPAPAPATALEITDRTALPQVVSTNMPMEFTAKVKGEAVSVTMSIKGPIDSTLALHKVITVGEITTWAANTPAPANPGIYRYYASAVGTDGTTVEMPGVSGWTFQVNP